MILKKNFHDFELSASCIPSFSGVSGLQAHCVISCDHRNCEESGKPSDESLAAFSFVSLVGNTYMLFMRFDCMKAPRVESNPLIMYVVPGFDDRTLVFSCSPILLRLHFHLRPKLDLR